jgi:predicted HTH domain antitoxin
MGFVEDRHAARTFARGGRRRSKKFRAGAAGDADNGIASAREIFHHAHSALIAARTILLALPHWAGHGSLMELSLPKPLEARLSARDVALHLAIGLFVSEEATLGQAAQTAGLSQREFLRELGSRHIPIHYGRDELEADLLAVEALATQ